MTKSLIPSVAISQDIEPAHSPLARSKQRLRVVSDSEAERAASSLFEERPKASAVPTPDIAPAAFYNTDMCPIRHTLDGVLGKWPFLILTHLSFGEHRFTELRGAVPDISQRMLTKTLRRLEADGLVLRTQYRTMPPHVDYRLTERGESLIPLVEPLLHWGLRNRATDEPNTIPKD